MITDYHINMILKRMSNIEDNQNAILQVLDRLVCAVGELTQQRQEIEMSDLTVTIQQPQDEEPVNKPEEVPQTPTAEPVEAEAKPAKPKRQPDPVAPNSDYKPSKNGPSKTKLYFEYRDRGGKLGWERWKKAGMPREDVAGTK